MTFSEQFAHRVLKALKTSQLLPHKATLTQVQESHASGDAQGVPFLLAWERTPENLLLRVSYGPNTWQYCTFRRGQSPFPNLSLPRLLAGSQTPSTWAEELQEGAALYSTEALPEGQERQMTFKAYDPVSSEQEGYLYTAEGWIISTSNLDLVFQT